MIDNSSLLFYNRHSVLFVEDKIEENTVVINFINKLIKKVKFRDSHYAVKDFDKEDFDFIIINISNDNEIDAMHKIRKNSPTIPILVITDFSKPNYLLESQKLSVFSFITKPYDINQLLEQINRVSEYLESEKNAHNTLNKLNHSLSLCREYEQAINESNILSRSNLNGMITYVNDKFCEVSGYTKEQLMGRSHNIVRHEDTPDSTFTNMWKNMERYS